MKKITLLFISAITVFGSVNLNAQQIGIFRVNGGTGGGNERAVQIGYSDYRFLTFGFGNTYDGEERGHWAIEHWDGGLNFYRVWPAYRWGNYKVFIHNFGQVGIGMKADGYNWVNQLQVQGKVQANGYNTWSDERLKENIAPFENALAKIKELNPVVYNYRTDVPYFDIAKVGDDVGLAKKQSTIEQDATLHEDFKKDKRIGFLAQNLEKVIPEVVETNSKGLKSVDYDDLIPVAIQAIKEQQKQIELLQSELENVKALNRLVNHPKGIGVKATLYQNDPNPFNQSTTIKYNIESTFETAKLLVFDYASNIKVEQNITTTGEGSYTLEANQLNAGTYHYSLIINGVVVDTRIMFLVK